MAKTDVNGTTPHGQSLRTRYDRQGSPPADPLHSSLVTPEELLATFDDDRDFVQEIVAVFLSRCPILMREIREAVLAGDAGAISRAVHTLRGSIGYFEQGEACNAAETIAHISTEGLPRVPALLATLHRSVGDITRYLNAEFSS